MLRISVNGGGCSGFQYAFDVDRTRQDDDLVVEQDGATVLVDEVSLQYMDGSVIDFVDDLIGPVVQDRESPRDRVLRLRDVVFALSQPSAPGSLPSLPSPPPRGAIMNVFVARPSTPSRSSPARPFWVSSQR